MSVYLVVGKMHWNKDYLKWEGIKTKKLSDKFFASDNKNKKYIQYKILIYRRLLEFWWNLTHTQKAR